MPDETLFELARQGKLKDPKVRREQTLRMLQDARANRFVKDFVYQWLDLEKLKIIEPDVSIFTVDEFDLVRDQIKKEPVEFFKEVLSSNLSLLNFIDSDFVMITPELNYIYRIEGHPIAKPRKRPGASKVSPVDYRPKEITSEFSKVMLGEKNRYRGGLLSQAGVHADDDQQRGIYQSVLSWCLGVEEFLRRSFGDSGRPGNRRAQSADENGDDQTNDRCPSREVPVATSATEKMDPLGIALENFDVMGRWRDQYTDVSNYSTSKKKNTGRFPVDTRTVHMDGRAFEGPQGLKKILMEDKAKFSRAFVENMLSYAMARQLTFLDRENLDQLYKQSADTDFRLRDILLAIVSSDYFTRR